MSSYYACLQFQRCAKKRRPHKAPTGHVEGTRTDPNKAQGHLRPCLSLFSPCSCPTRSPPPPSPTPPPSETPEGDLRHTLKTPHMEMERPVVSPSSRRVRPTWRAVHGGCGFRGWFRLVWAWLGATSALVVAYPCCVSGGSQAVGLGPLRVVQG